MKEQIARKVLIFAGSAVLFLFAISPFLWMLTVSFVSRPDFYTEASPVWSLSNYREVLQSSSLRFMDYFRNSMIVSVSAAVLVTSMASFAGYAVSRMQFRGRMVIPVTVLALSMFPQICIVGFLFRLFSMLGWINTPMALILPYTALTIPLALWIIMSSFMQVPLDIDKAAFVDGAGRVKTLFAVVLPIAAPGIFSAFLLVFIQCFNEFLFAVMLTIDYQAQTLPVGIALFEGLHGEIPWGGLMAASVLGSVPLVLLTIVCQKFIVAGLAGGAVKG